MTEVLSRDAFIWDLRDESCRVGMRAAIRHRTRVEMSDKDRKIWERMDELDREQAGEDR